MYPGVADKDLSQHDPPDAQDIAAAAAAAQTQGVGVQPASPLTPQQSAAANPYKVTGWKKDDTQFDIVTPSGQRCRAKKLNFEAAISSGILNDVDMFTNALMADPNDSAKANVTILQVLSDPERRAKFFGVMNRCVSQCIVLPKLSMHDDGNLPDDTVFVDDIPFPDKMYIFSVCFKGRVETLDPFREGQEAGVGDMATGESVQPATP